MKMKKSQLSLTESYHVWAAIHFTTLCAALQSLFVRTLLLLLYFTQVPIWRRRVPKYGFGGQNQSEDWIFQDVWTCLTSCDPASLQIGDPVPFQHCCTSPCWGCWCPWGRAAQSWHASSPLEQPPTSWQLNPIGEPWSMMVFQVDVYLGMFSVF